MVLEACCTQRRCLEVTAGLPEKAISDFTTDDVFAIGFGAAAQKIGALFIRRGVQPQRVQYFGLQKTVDLRTFKT